MIIEPEKYTERPFKVSMIAANLLTLPFAAVVLLIFLGIYNVIWNTIAGGFEYSGGVAVIGILIGAVIHELIHGLTAMRYSEKGWKSIKFGIMWKYLMPYCHYSEPLTVKQYRKVALMPSIVAFVVMFVSIAFGLATLLVIASILFIGGIGDFMVCYKIRNERASTLIYDYPDKVGGAIFELKTDNEQSN